MSENQKKTVWEGKFIKVVLDGRWQYVERKGIAGIVGIIPVTEDNKIVLIDQKRIPVGGRVIELPAGLVGDEPGREDEPFEEAARRELFEETGYEAQTLEPICEGVVSAGLTNESIKYYLASGCKKVGPGGGDGNEDIIVHEIPLWEVLDWIAEQEKKGKLVDVKSYGMLAFWLRQPPKIQGN